MIPSRTAVEEPVELYFEKRGSYKENTLSILQPVNPGSGSPSAASAWCSGA